MTNRGAAKLPDWFLSDLFCALNGVAIAAVAAMATGPAMPLMSCGIIVSSRYDLGLLASLRTILGLGVVRSLVLPCRCLTRIQQETYSKN